MIELYDGLEFGGFVLRASETGREQLEHAQAASEQLVLKANYQNIHIPLDSILYIKALDNYIKVYKTDGTTLLSKITMSGVETMLPKEKFLRIHRSYIIAHNRIISYSNAYIQLEKCSFKMRIGKSYVNRVAEVLDEKYYANE